jgi:hypothetical protein
MNTAYKYNKVRRIANKSPVTIERGAMLVCYPCDIFISVGPKSQVSYSTKFVKLKR